MDVVMDAIRTAVARHIGARLYPSKGQMLRILGALRTAHRGAGHKGTIPDAAFPAVADGQYAAVGGHGNAVRERTAVHYSAQNTVMRILVNGTRAVSRAWAWTGSPGIGEEQIAFGI